MLVYKKAEASDYTELVKVWRDSVKKTHLFLSEKERTIIEKKLPNYFKDVEVLIWFENDSSETIIGFSGTKEKKLEMLFLDPIFFRKGYGKKILNWLVQNKSIRMIDVNKQNPNAVAFYLSQGFTISSESSEDSQGNLFPILHLEKENF